MKLFQRERKAPEPRILPQVAINYPSGVVVKVDDQYFFIKKNYRLRYISQQAWTSWSLPYVEGTEKSLAKFPVVGKIGYRDGSVVKDISDAKIYFISDATKRHIVSPDVFAKYGISEKFLASQKELVFHEDGEDLE